MRIVHLPFYDDNPYQTLLMRAQSDMGHETIRGGGGGRFLGTYLRKWRADVMHFHWLHPYILGDSIAATLWKTTRLATAMTLMRLGGSRLHWTMHNLTSHSSHQPKLERFAQRWIAIFFHRVIVHSQVAAELATTQLKVPRRKITVVPHPMYPTVRIPESKQQLRCDRNIAEDSFVVLFVGRVDPYKGIDDLVNAFERLSIPNARLVIAGKPVDDEYAQSLRQKCESNPRIDLQLHYQSDEELAQWMRVADVVALPFKNILTSGSLLLAASYCKPVIIPRTGGIAESLPDDYPLAYEPDTRDIANQLADMMKAAAEPTGISANLGSVLALHLGQTTWNNLAEAGT